MKLLLFTYLNIQELHYDRSKLASLIYYNLEGGKLVHLNLCNGTVIQLNTSFLHSLLLQKLSRLYIHRYMNDTAGKPLDRNSNNNDSYLSNLNHT